MTLNNAKHPLDTNEMQKDFWITLDTKLSLDNHINHVVNKATKMTKIIPRTFQFLDKDTFKQLYKTMERTHLDYTVAVLYPKIIIAREIVQRRATNELPVCRQIKPTETSLISIYTFTRRYD